MNIIDYLKWRGDLSFKAAAFNEVDALVISYAAYTLIEPYMEEGRSYTVKEIADRYLGDHTKEEIDKDPSLIGKAPLALKGMAESERFKDAVLHDYVSILNDDRTEQFCAFELDLSDKTTFIAFRGTDDTLLGWHEDFCLSYRTVDAQIQARDYLRKHIRGRRKYRIGGHSKGGNLAIYAALNCPEKHRNILAVYSLDGPGLNPDFIGKDYRKNMESLEKRFIKIVPEFDVVGTIYDNDEKKKVIKSDAFTIMQHSAMSWQVEGDHFVGGEAAKETAVIENAFRNFLRTSTPEQCEELTTQLFRAFKKAKVRNVSDFAKGGIPVIIATLNEFGKMNDESKAIADMLLGCFVDEYKQSLITDTLEFRDEVKKKLLKAKRKAIPGRTASKDKQ